MDKWFERAGLTRRAAFKLSLLAGASAAAIAVDLPAATATAVPTGPFRHGVASGDPLSDRVILWTRITVLGSNRPIAVGWQVSATPDMTQLVRQGTTVTSPARDWTVKVDATGLQPGTTYWYRFVFDGAASPVGRTRTLPVGAVARLKLAVFSCSNFENGFFNAYREAAAIDDLDLCLHLGDYIYEYANGLETPATAVDPDLLPRLDQLRPRREILSLRDYRTRHALYKSDPDLQALHAHCPWITVWDDHESANDAWTGGAENHQPATEGDWQARKARSVQVYYEWMPVREPADRQRIDPATGNPDDLYRSFDVGDLARIVMLDTRQAGRDEQVDAFTLAGIYQGAIPDTTPAGTTRTMLGDEQETWLAGRLATSPQTWQLIGNQILAFYQNAPDIAGSTILTATEKANLNANIDALFGPGASIGFQQVADAGGPSGIATDAWTGYPTARARLLALLATARNPVLLTGDSHNAWTANLKAPTPVGLVPIAVELGGTSVSSPGFEQFLLAIPPASIAGLLVESSTNKSPTDKLIYSDAGRRGFLLVDVTPARVRAEHVFVSTVFETSYAVSRAAFEVAAGSRTAVAA